MKNKYKIKESFFRGIPFLKVWGASFGNEDLYELVGKDQFMSTFILKTGTVSSKRFGQSVTGVIFYAKDESEAHGRLNKEGKESGEGRVQIDSPMRELNQAQREDLKYSGLSVADIEYISFIPYKKDEEHYESGEKKVPNIIYIPYDDDLRVNYDILYQNYIASKINHKTELIPYEKEKFIGITLGINDGHIHSRLLNYLGFDIERVRACDNIWYHAYKTKERRKKISEEEKSKLADLEFIRRADNILKLFNEIKKSGVNQEKILKSGPVFKTIISSISKFEPSVLLHGKKQIFWDVESYLHIVLRHVKQHQVGHFKNKTPFPYKFEDLEILIKQVLGTVEDEIKRHYKEKPGKDFRRYGRMSVLFNRDYYCLHIDKQGRLVTLYVNK